MPILFDERRRWAQPAATAIVRNYAALETLGGSRQLFETDLPRGSLVARSLPDRERLNYWMAPGALMRHRFRLGQIIVGKIANKSLGHLDDRLMITTAAARVGKSSTVLMPNLFLYPGSMLVLDPKGELCRTAWFRRAMGHYVGIVDPYGITGEKSACFNCFEELDERDRQIVDRAASIALATAPEEDGAGGGNAKHFNDTSRTFLKGLILFVLGLPDKTQRNLVTVRQLINLSYPPLVEATRREAARERARAAAQGRSAHIDLTSLALNTLLNQMKSYDRRFGGVVAAVGHLLSGMGASERGGVLSTAARHTDFADSIPVADIMRHSDFALSTLRADRPATIFLVLPIEHLEQQYRLLRIFVQLTCSTLERMGLYPRNRPPILFMMEEFAVLGHMQIMEKAAAYFPGFGIKLWIVLQSLQQLINHYPRDYQTFLGNAGLIQMFGIGDDPALSYLTSRMGKLIEPHELRRTFSRASANQLLLMEGEAPAAAKRLTHEDVDRIQAYAEHAVLRQSTLH